jgi:hypothetical protein
MCSAALRKEAVTPQPLTESGLSIGSDALLTPHETNEIPLK